ncbi:YHYH protein [Planctomycetaceae bacterium SH139]
MPSVALAQRTHRVNEKGQLIPQPSTVTPDVDSAVSIKVVGDQRIIIANAIPAHKVGQFPSRGNPNRMTPQRLEYRIPAHPQVADEATPMNGEFGVAINGVPFDPSAAEVYAGDRNWRYEPLSGAIALGIDVSHAHVQPNGKYHYHGLPTGLLDTVKLKSSEHSPLIGWAADGFPIYAVYGYSNPQEPNSTIEKLTSSYQLKKGDRPAGNAPGGKYDGTFIQDYEFVAGSGDLDECNGRQTVTPEFPAGTYAYFMTEEWPVVPRFHRGTPSADFQRGGGRAGGPGPGSPGAGRPRTGRPGAGRPGTGRPGPGRLGAGGGDVEWPGLNSE